MAAPPQLRRLRRPLVALAAAACLAPAAACGGVSLADDDSDALTTMGFTRGDAIANVRLDMATEALAGTDVRVTEGAFDEQQFLSSVAAGDPPDVVRMDRALMGGYADRGAIMPLTQCLKDERVDVGQFREAVIDEASLDGTVYGLPDSYDSRPLLINGALLKEAGVEPSDVDTSDWDGLRALARKLHQEKDGKLTRIGFDPKIPEFFPLWTRANGGSLISADGRTAQLDSPEVVEALEFTTGVIDDQGGWGRFKALRDSFDQFGEQNPFVRNQIGVYPMEDWYLSVLGGVTPKIDLHTRPFLDREGKPINYVSGLSWAIPKGARNPEQACKFITSMTSVEAWTTAAKAKAKEIRSGGAHYVNDLTGNVIADRRIAEEVWKPTGNRAFDEASGTLRSIQDDPVVVPANAAGTEFRRAWMNAVNSVLSGSQSPREALEEAQDRAQSALDRGEEQGRG